MNRFFDVVNPTLVGVITLNIIVLGIVYSILIDVARIDKSKKGANILKFHNSTPPIHMVWGSLLYLCTVYFLLFLFHNLYSTMGTMPISESLEGANNSLNSYSFSNITYVFIGIGILWPPIWHLRTMYLAKKGKITIIKREIHLFSTFDIYNNIGKNILFLIIASCILGMLF